MSLTKRFAIWLNFKLNKLVNPVKMKKGDNSVSEPFFHIYEAQQRLYITWNPSKCRTISVQWKWFVNHSRLAVNFSDHDDKLYIAFGCFLFDANISFEFLHRKFLKWVLKGGTARDFGFDISTNFISGDFWYDDFGHATKQGWSYFKNTNELLRGYPDIEVLEVGKGEVVGVVPAYSEYPEQQYKAEVLEKIITHNYTRWYFFGLYRRSFYQYDVKVKTRHVHAGKGENSWDCDDVVSDNLCFNLDYDEPRLSLQEAGERWKDNLIDSRRKYG